jgi:hypothetical protein
MPRQRRDFTGADKVRILREHLIDKVPISEVCEKHGLQPTVFYQWQKKLFEDGAAVSEHPRRKDPRFIDPAGPDGILDGQPSAWADNNYRLNNSIPSPCIDKGNTPIVVATIVDGTDLDGSERIQGCNIDLGAYETSAVLAAPTTDGIPRNRYIAFTPGNPGRLAAYRITLTASSEFPAAVGRAWWVGNPVDVSEQAGVTGPYPGWPNFKAAPVQCDPVYLDWAAIGEVSAYGPEIVPGATYDIQAVGQDCDPNDDASFSPPLTVTMSKWGDVVAPFAVDGQPGQPNFEDIGAVQQKYANNPNAPAKNRCDLGLALVDFYVGFIDIGCAVNGYKSIPYSTTYPGGPQLDCPPPPSPYECRADVAADIDGDGDIDVFDEALESTQTLFLVVNSDDDNVNEIPDKDEAPVEFEDDLEELQLGTPYCDPPDPGAAWWSISWDDPDPPTLEVWLYADKSDGLGGPATPLGNGVQQPWPPPESIWVESMHTFDSTEIVLSLADGENPISAAAGNSAKTAKIQARANCTPSTFSSRRWYIGAVSYAPSSGPPFTQPTATITTRSLTPLCGEGTTQKFPYETTSSAWVMLLRTETVPGYGAVGIFAQTGYMRNREPGTTIVREGVYWELYSGNDYDVEIDPTLHSSGDHDYAVLHWSPLFGTWYYLLDHQYVMDYTNDIWIGRSGEEAQWFGEITHKEDTLAGQPSAPCHFTTCRVESNWYPSTWGSPGFVAGDVVFFPPSPPHPGAAEYGKQFMGPDAFDIWDVNP